MTTCQICGRPIKANTGVIAHHGYQRPHLGSGWQTSSCMRARHLPYEQSCDLIPMAIASIENFILKSQMAIDNLMSNPPEKLIYQRGSGYGAKSFEVICPDEFNPLSANRTRGVRAYDTIFFERIYDINLAIKDAQNDLAYLQNRLAAWVAPIEVLK